MSNIRSVTSELVVRRSDPVYMAHAYLTKVPVAAIVPFIEANTKPGDVVADPFAGSGMTGVAAAITGRSARLSDISVLGQHIGRNYLNLVDRDLLTKNAQAIVDASIDRLNRPYAAGCQKCENPAELSKTVWSIVVRCGQCDSDVVFYRALEAADWQKSKMVCPRCAGSVSSRDDRIGEVAVLEHVRCECHPTQQEQQPAGAGASVVEACVSAPHVEITPDRQMYHASALRKSGLTTVASFYSTRNLAVLADLRQRIGEVADDSLRSKLLFAFTACLTRASKRYQWSRARPLNAANANYYVAPVFYEWNVYDLFLRKVEAAAKADDWIQSGRNGEPGGADVTYAIASADNLALDDSSVDYVFTDPPFGSNLFYSDMALFQEAWLDSFTDLDREAVIDRTRSGTRTAERYELLLTEALLECRRVLKPGGRISLVFGNSSGAVWALVQRVIRQAGLRIDPDTLVVLNKGQRSVKGLASGFEHVATLDLVLTLVEGDDPTAPPLHEVTVDELRDVVIELAGQSTEPTPSHLYLALLRHGFRCNWRLDQVNLRIVTETLLVQGWSIDTRTGALIR